MTVPWLLFAAQLFAAESQPSGVKRGTSDPYAGDLSIFEGADRAENLKIERVMDELRIKPGTNVADIGAGSGWFTVRAARRVAKEDTVYAVEINREYVRHIRNRAKKEKLPNIRTVLAKADDPLLPARSVDAVLLLKTYHEVATPIALLKKLRDAMRPGARLGIIDKNGIGTDHGLNADVVIKEAEQAGFALAEQHDFVKSEGVDYFLIFKARP
ncbi:MAG TPA: class I SAM-dependent methyltransferase [Chthoniobacterales bacterium]|nr:class I SAM-dependent methyltransferase [Chthoniobacterales bacterium]